MAEAATASTTDDRVELRVPADPAYLAVLRTATAGLAARLDLTLDEIEDLRIAVDEACALVLGVSGDPLDAGGGATVVQAAAEAAARAADPVRSQETLRAVFDLGPDGMSVEVSGPATSLPGRESFAWAVLEALVGALETGTDDEGRQSIRMRHGGSRRPS